VKVWATDTGSLVRTMQPASNAVSVALSFDGGTVLAWEMDGRLASWDVKTGRPRHAPLEAPAHRGIVAACPDGAFRAALARSGQIRVLRVENGRATETDVRKAPSHPEAM